VVGTGRYRLRGNIQFLPRETEEIHDNFSALQFSSAPYNAI